MAVLGRTVSPARLKTAAAIIIAHVSFSSIFEKIKLSTICL